jgi:SAM-dependent methyltransferase
VSAGFADHFSAVAAGYASHRPDYPPALFSWLAAQCARRDRAWDCATGSGQAARGLAAHFAAVIATDASARQIGQAAPAPGVEFRVAPAERSGLEAASVDLVAVAQALHWFAGEAFYAEARSVLRPGGVLAAWGYGRLRFGAPRVEAVLLPFYEQALAPFWPEERRHVETQYRSLPFPAPEIAAPQFGIERRWNLAQTLGYIGTWSAVSRAREAGASTVWETFAAALARVWGDPAREQAVHWPLFLRAARF